MDDRIPGTEQPTIERQDVTSMLSSAAEKRAFNQFQSECCESSYEIADKESTLDAWLRDHSATWRKRRQITAAQMQAEEIRKHRWIESEKVHRDLGKEAHTDWVKQYAAEWRNWFENHYDGPLEECD
jgi:hypothetical protein